MNVFRDNSAFFNLNECYDTQFCIFKAKWMLLKQLRIFKLTECYYIQFSIFKDNWC